MLWSGITGTSQRGEARQSTGSTHREHIVVLQQCEVLQVIWAHDCSGSVESVSSASKVNRIKLEHVMCPGQSPLNASRTLQASLLIKCFQIPYRIFIAYMTTSGATTSQPQLAFWAHRKQEHVHATMHSITTTV